MSQRQGKGPVRDIDLTLTGGVIDLKAHLAMRGVCGMMMPYLHRKKSKVDSTLVIHLLIQDESAPHG